jgi:D-aminopeptidase
MKHLIACDREEISEVVNWDQVDLDHPEYPRFCRMLIQDINAVFE